MPSTATRSSALLLGLLACAAGAHPTGFHKKLTVTLTRTQVTALVVMDVDAGDRCLLLREAADSDRDGWLAGDEVATLKARLTKLATAQLRVALSGAPLRLEVKAAKVTLRRDRRAGDGPLSVAVLLALTHPHPVGPGLAFEVQDAAPDLSAVVVQVFQQGVAGAPFEAEVPSGAKATVRLGALGD